jgi:hypothetical protein
MAAHRWGIERKQALINREVLSPDLKPLLVDSPSLHSEFRFTDKNRSATAAVRIYFEKVR